MIFPRPEECQIIDEELGAREKIRKRTHAAAMRLDRLSVNRITVHIVGFFYVPKGHKMTAGGNASGSHTRGNPRWAHALRPSKERLKSTSQCFKR